jgi:hypothetical protein
MLQINKYHSTLAFKLSLTNALALTNILVYHRICTLRARIVFTVQAPDKSSDKIPLLL